MSVDVASRRDLSALAESAPDTPQPVKGKGRTETLARKFIIAFSAMFIIPLFIAVYLFMEYTTGISTDSIPFMVIVISVLLLGTAGFFVTQSVVHTLIRTTRDAAAIAGGDITRRLNTDAATEISELAKNFNRITSRLQHTVDNLQTSKKQMQSLLSQVCSSSSQRRDITDIFNVFLNTLLSLTGLETGAIFLMSRTDNTMKMRVSSGVSDELKSMVVQVGEGVAGWVAANGQSVTISESMPWKPSEGFSDFERSMAWSIHVPMMAGGKTRGVISMGLRKGEKEVTGDDLQMIQNLASQVAVAMENADLKEKMERTYVETVAALATAVEARDLYTRGHSKRVTEFSIAIAKRMNLPDWFVRDVDSAALLHDIGKIGIPDHILHNTGALPPDGVTFVLGHTIGGENILRPVGSLARLCPIVRHHHERYDGKGYPDSIKGEEIPLAARILAVADSFDAMISARAYKPTRTREEAVEELIRCKDAQFDSECVDVFVAYLAENPEVGILEPA